MAGIFHALFGCIIGLLAWKLTEGKNGGEKRYSLGLVFVFAINNYVGPDFGAVLEEIGDALGSAPLIDLGSGIHSYLGFLFFAIPWAVMWYALLLGIEQSRIRNLAKAGLASEEPALHASYPKVLVMVVAAGIAHHFEDSISHPSTFAVPPPDISFPRGRFVLIPTMTPDFWVAYAVAIAAVAVPAVLYLLVGNRQRRFTVKQKVMTAFTRETVWVAIFVGIVLLNVGLMYAIMAWGNLVETTGSGIMFYLGNALQAARMFDGDAKWWIAAAAAPTIVLFFLCHAKAWRLRIAGRRIRADLFVVFCFVAAILAGYALQPVIGNISGTESDVAALVYAWSTIGSMLLGFILARSNGASCRAGT
jgi:hypothetical protein